MPFRVFKEFRFEAAHYLVNVPRDHKCARMHGHSYMVRIECAGVLDGALGWVVDYADIATAWALIHDALDHHFINDVPGLEVSTSEHLACWIYRKMKPALTGLVLVEVRETATAGAVYTESGTRVGHDALPWAADNGCFTGFEPVRFVRMLERVPAGGLFVACPDVVGSHDATLDLWHRWAPLVRSYQQRVAFVLQDGCTKAPRDAGAVFVGGSTEYKLSRTAAKVVHNAKRRGAWAHMGRVNTRRRMMYAASIGCDSVDGTSPSMFPDTKMPRFLAWAETASRQLVMKEAA